MGLTCSKYCNELEWLLELYMFLIDTILIDLACSTLSILPNYKAPWQKKMKGTILLRKWSVCSISISLEVMPHD